MPNFFKKRKGTKPSQPVSRRKAGEIRAARVPRKTPRRIPFDRAMGEIEARVNELRKNRPVVIVALSGGSASGKTSFARNISERLGASLLQVDDYCLGENHIKKLGITFDDPASRDLGLLREHLDLLKRGAAVQKPVYSFEEHSRKGNVPFSPAKVVIVEGHFAFHPLVLGLADLRVYLEAPTSVRLQRRLERDTKERGSDRQKTLRTFEETVQPKHKMFVKPMKRLADIIVNQRP